MSCYFYRIEGHLRPKYKIKPKKNAYIFNEQFVLKIVWKSTNYRLPWSFSFIFKWYLYGVKSTNYSLTAVQLILVGNYKRFISLFTFVAFRHSSPGLTHRMHHKQEIRNYGKLGTCRYFSDCCLCRSETVQYKM